MNLKDYLIPVSDDLKAVSSSGSFGDTIILYGTDLNFDIPDSVRVALLGVPEDRFSDNAGEIKMPEKVRKQLYALSVGTPGSVIDLGNIRTGKTLSDTYYALNHVLSEMLERGIVTWVIGGTLDVFYGSYLAVESSNPNLTVISPHLRLPSSGAEGHPINDIIFNQSSPVHFCNVGYQSYYVADQDLGICKTKHHEVYRLGSMRLDNLRECEPVMRDSDLLALSLNSVKYSDAPAASIPSPNGFSGEEICQMAFYAGLGYRCKIAGIFDMIPDNDLRDITAKLSAQIAWYFFEGVKKRNPDHPSVNPQNFKKYVIYFDQLHHNLSFYKNIKTERWWMEIPSLKGGTYNELISCTYNDYVKSSEQEIPDRWWKTYQRIN